MATKILMNVCDGEECRIAVIENGILQEYFVDRPSQLTHVGDVYRAVVTNVESAIQAAFVDLGYRKNAFLHVSDVIAAYHKPVKLPDLYGRSLVEITPVEEIDFSKAPDREIELDDDDDDFDGDDDDEGRAAVDEIEAPEIVSKAEYEASREEFAMQQTVAMERGAREAAGEQALVFDDDHPNGDQADGDATDHPGHRGTASESAPRGHAGSAPSDSPSTPLTPEEEEERVKAEERRRKGMRRKLRLSERLGDQRRGDRSGKAEASDEQAEGSVRTEPMRNAPAAKPTVAPATPAPAKRAAAPAQPASEPTPPKRDVLKRTLTRTPPVEGIPVESKASARVKLALPVRKPAAETDDTTESTASKAPLPPQRAVPIDAPKVESKAAPRLKLNLRKPAPEQSKSEESGSEAPNGEANGGGHPPAEFSHFALDPLSGGFSGIAGAELQARGPMAHRADTLANARRYRFTPMPKLQNTLHRGQEMLVQVARAAQGGKGPSVTTYISLPGRYMVLMPNTSKCGVSRKIRDHKTRMELRKALRRLRVPEGMGVIIRTAAAGRPIEELQRDLNYLLGIWNTVLTDVNSGKSAPSCCYRDSDPAVRTVRDYFTKDVAEIVIDDRVVYERVLAFFDQLMPDYRDRVRFYDGGVPLFAREGIEPQIEHIFDKKVPLPSGGYLFVEQTEALVAIDVNSGRFTSENSAEETAYKTNLEAVPEIVRQLRLRDLGGIVVGDFIDMMESRHRREVEERLKAELRKGRARIKVATTSPFGLIEMTRQRVRPSIRVYTYNECATCKGFGHVMSQETQALRLIRSVRLVLASDSAHGCVVAAPADVLSYLHSNMRPHLQRVEEKYDKPVAFEWDPTLQCEELKLWYINARGDRTAYNLPGELSKLASSRQLAGFDTNTAGGNRRRRGGRGRRGTDGTSAPDGDETSTKGINAPTGGGAGGDVELLDFDRRDQRDRRDRRGPDGPRDRPRQPRDSGRDGPRDSARDSGRDTPRPPRDTKDARDVVEEKESAEERREHRRGRDRRGRDRRPRDDAKAQHPGAAHPGSPDSAAKEPGQPALPPAPAGAEAEGGDAAAGRRRRGRRGGRRHRRRDGEMSNNPGETNGNGNGNGEADRSGPNVYGSVHDVAGYEEQREHTQSGEETTDLRGQLLNEVMYQPRDGNGSIQDRTGGQMHGISMHGSAADEVAEDRLSEMERHLTVVAAAVARGMLNTGRLTGLRKALSDVAELADRTMGEGSEEPSAADVAAFRDAREHLASAVAEAYMSLPESTARELLAAAQPDQHQQALEDLINAMLGDDGIDVGAGDSGSKRKKAASKKATTKKAASKATAKKATSKAAPKKAAVKKPVAKKAPAKAPAKAAAPTAKKATTKVTKKPAAKKAPTRKVTKKAAE